MAILQYLRGRLSRKGTRSPRKIPRIDMEKTIDNLRQELKRLESDYNEVEEENRNLRSQLQKCSCNERSELQTVGTKTDIPVSALHSPLDSQVSVMDSPVNALDSRVGALDSRVSALDSPVCALDSPVGALDSRVGAVESPVNAVDSPVCALDSRVSALDSRVSALDSPVNALDSPVRAQDSPASALDSRVSTLDSPARETEPNNVQSVMCGVSHVHGQQLTVAEPAYPLNSSCSISEEDSGFLTPSADKPAESASAEGPSWVPWSENNHQALADLIRECRHHAQPKESLQNQGQLQVPAKVNMDDGGTTMEQPQKLAEEEETAARPEAPEAAGGTGWLPWSEGSQQAHAHLFREIGFQPRNTNCQYHPWFVENRADSVLRPPVHQHYPVLEGPVCAQLTRRQTTTTHIGMSVYTPRVQIPSAHSAFTRVLQ